MSQHSGSLPKAFRFAAPRTPEPSDGSEEMQFPSPPRPRLKLKRRNVSHQHQRTAPTEQFLASVAAADLPIPSIEEPTLPSSGAPEIMSSFPTFSLPDSTANEQDTHLLVPRGRAFSPPKTRRRDSFRLCHRPGIQTGRWIQHPVVWSRRRTQTMSPAGRPRRGRPRLAPPSLAAYRRCPMRITVSVHRSTRMTASSSFLMKSSRPMPMPALDTKARLGKHHGRKL